MQMIAEPSFAPRPGRFTEIREIEMDQIEFRYSRTRVAKPRMVSSLVSSIERSGQIVPVIAVKESDFSFVLIDGYLRAAALKRCGQDTVNGHVEDKGMRHVYIKPRSPQLNGKVERSHRTDQEEFYQLLTYTDDVDLNKKAAAWERFYNLDRPHGAFKCFFYFLWGSTHRKPKCRIGSQPI
jgi:hypothetical protein